jgi:para-aminobenzoate synthetase component 1
MNELGGREIPFLFIIDFSMDHALVVPRQNIAGEDILFQMPGCSNIRPFPELSKSLHFEKRPVSFGDYSRSFDIVRKHFILGNTFLTNLTFPTPIDINLTLKEIFYYSRAKFKLLVDGVFVVFSPEIFVRIRDGIISSYPMKGTIDASLPNAESVILADEKESAEHVTIVDLIRNDIGIIADKVQVTRFRYIDSLTTNQKTLLQVSSEITGTLGKDYRRRIGDIVFAMLPAGSITGAPKKKTVEIIREAETYDRGYYTGIFGYFDGANLDSAVMIRFIEQSGEGLLFKSGGGLTVYSDVHSEYQEYIDKVYVPIY